MKEIILRDAKMCAYAAGNVEYFKYLMRSLGYKFKFGAWMEIQVPGYRYYHSLEKMDEMFSENMVRYRVDMSWMVQPHFYSKDIRQMKQNNLSPFQKRFYAKMYRLRIVEQNRFKINAIKYADDLKRFHQLQDEYLMLVDNNIRDFSNLLNYKNEQENKIREIDDRQHEIHRLNSSKKRAIKTDEQYRDYQLWHMGIQKELDVLKQQKKDVKRQLGLMDMAIKENLYTACGDVPNMETKLIEDNEMVIPRMETEQEHEVNMDKIVSIETEDPDVGIGREATKPDNEVIFQDGGCVEHDFENIAKVKVEHNVKMYDELICNPNDEGMLYASYDDSEDVYCDSSEFRVSK